MSDCKPKRTRRFVPLAVYSLILIWVVFIAATRWNGVPKRPARPSGGAGQALISIDAALDRTNEIIAALASVPPMPPVVLPPPPDGMKWGPIKTSSIDGSDALNGDWTPETRPNLQCVIDYLNSATTTKVFDQLAAIEAGECRLTGGSASSFRQAAKMFVARARMQYEENDDMKAALADLAAINRLSATIMHSGDSTIFLTAIACQALADSELKRLSHERPFTGSEATAAKEMLTNISPDFKMMWQHVIECECTKLDHVLDAAYTDDAQGNGWLVLSQLDELSLPTRASKPRSGAWNCLSVFYNDRKTVSAKLNRYRESCERAGQLPYRVARTAVNQIESSARFFTILDGPFAQVKFGTTTAYLYRLVTNRSADRIGTLTTVALSAYRHDHGTYPSSLAELIGKYSERLPDDPFGDGPLHYKLLNDSDYLLYSVGPDGVDDGGTERSRDHTGQWNGDEIMRHHRPAPNWEPELIKSNN